jgi:chromosome segregation ATPase
MLLLAAWICLISAGLSGSVHAQSGSGGGGAADPSGSAEQAERAPSEAGRSTDAADRRESADLEADEPEIGEVRAKLEQWVETRRIISKEQREWELAREMLTGRIDVVQREIESLREKIEETKQDIAQAEQTRSELQSRNERLKAASAALEQTLADLESGVRRLVARLPDSVLEEIRQLTQQLPEEGEEADQPMSNRFGYVLGILQQVNKFHSEVRTTSEIRRLAEGRSAEVTTVYLGLGQAYYVGTNGQVAGLGTASAEAWVWEAADSAAEEVAAAVAILDGEQVARFVRVPLEVK